MEKDEKSRSQGDRGSSMRKASGQWEFLKSKFEAGQLGHAYLFCGHDQAGIKEFALELIALVNKEIAKSGIAIEKEQFPDLMVVDSAQSDSSLKNEKDMMEIDVDQIRAVNNFLSLTSYYGGYKAVIVNNAERLGVEAQHSFLKTLEEPKGKTLIILICQHPELLLPTIVSRCQVMVFSPTGQYVTTNSENQLLKELLPIMQGELAAKFAYAKKVNLEGNNAKVMFKVLQRYFRNLLLVKIGVVEGKDTSRYSLEKLTTIIHVIEKLHWQMSFANASPKLALEVLLLEL